MNPQDLSQAEDPELRGSLAAMQRAAKMARQIAIQTNTAIVVVENGKPVRIPAEELRRQEDDGAITIAPYDVRRGGWQSARWCQE
jgi:DNA-directed RNA polymerase subunit K/omega